MDVETCRWLLGRQTRALGADRILDDLHHQGLPVEHRLLDRLQIGVVRFAGHTRMPDIGDMQKGGPFETDVDKRGLHARQHTHHLAEIDIPNASARQGALHMQFLHGALLNESHPRLLRRNVDQDVFVHILIMVLESLFKIRHAPLSKGSQSRTTVDP